MHQLADLAQHQLGNELATVAVEGNFRYARAQIRRQRTRWGSCSASGTISLNVCLMFLSPAVVRYLFVHELCHTRHMNHSAHFWALVERAYPGYRDAERWLKARAARDKVTFEPAAAPVQRPEGPDS